MAGYCTCGTQLVEDALFCHKCGRPTRELVAPEEPEVPELVVASQPVPSPEAKPDSVWQHIGFRNRIAVRTALLMALGVSMMLFLPFGGALRTLASVIVLPAAGFAAVYLYQRRTGIFLTVTSGARMGWLTGLFVFLITLVMLSFMIVALMNPEVRESVRQQVNATGAGIDFEEFIHQLESPKLFGALLILFLFLTALPMIGGALGAKVLERE